MKKVLMITTHFAPDIHVGAKRMTKFAKYLPQYGWQPVVLTCQVWRYHGVDKTLLDQLPEDVRVHRVHEWSPFSDNANSPSIRCPASPGATERHRGLLPDAAIRIMEPFAFFDWSWLLPAFFQGRKLLQEEGIRIVFSSSPNVEAHLVALLLQRSMHVRWVCEYRDPWTNEVYFHLRPPLTRWIHRRMEEHVLRHADHVVAIGPLLLGSLNEMVLAPLDKKSSVIYNGYDPADFIGLEKLSEDRRLVLSYVGTCNDLHMPDSLLRALGRLLRRRPVLLDRIRIRFVGEAREWSVSLDLDRIMHDIVREEGLDEVVEFIPFTSHRRALAYMQATDALILLQTILPDHARCTDYVVTSKVFEYLYARRPILALVPPSGDVARILRDCKAGYLIPYDDVGAIERTLEETWDDFESGRLMHWSFNEAAIEQYNRRKQAEQLAQVMDMIGAEVM